ncbi:MAG: glycoside hydrolase family 3 C-terminal domain-containing protein [Cytophagales bacterium]|nr:glycoside hydrolase family 3 C-terminal domain-containing protein [Cytophagales bacterium]
MVTTHQINQSDAFVAAWLLGSEGDGVAEVLFGEHDFKGKLPHSWPKLEEDYIGKYGPNFRDNSIEPLFPLGFGLSYKPSSQTSK